MMRYEARPTKTDLKNETNWLKSKGYTNIKVETIEMNWIKITADEPKA